MPEPREATVEDLISGYATQYGIQPALALAVAKKESGRPDLAIPFSQAGPLNASTVGDGGQAVGFFQLHPGAASDTDTTDRSDPLQNISGGVKYLKQLSDKYHNDVEHILQAYNGGEGNFDAGIVSPQAKAYAADVIANLSNNIRPTGAAKPKTVSAAPSAAKATTQTLASRLAAEQQTEAERTGAGRALFAPFNPLTSEGRRNLVGTAGGIIGGALAPETGGISAAVLPWVAEALGASAGGAIAEAGEQTVGGKPDDGASIAGAAAQQGAYSLGGSLLFWPVRQVGRAILANTVGKNATDALGAELKVGRETASDTIRSARNAVSDSITAVRTAARNAIDRTSQLATGAVAQTKAAGEAAVAASTGAAAAKTVAAKRSAAEAVAKAELDAQQSIADATGTYDRLLQHPPSIEGTAQATREVLGGLPGIGGETGPAKRALDVAGQRVAAAAKTGPAVNFGAVKDALDTMAEKVRPRSLFQPSQPTRGIGFVRNIAGIQPSRAAAALPTAEETASLTRAIAQQLGLPETHPLPGVLAQIQSAPDTITFADAHQAKRLLDEAVNWDRTAKKHLEALTKGVRTTLREAMSGYAPYDEATASYQALVPLYRKGVGQQLIRSAATRPDQVARVLSEKNPAAAQAVKDLLVTQSAAGGDPAMGQQAWDSVRATYTYNHVIQGGVEKLSDRVHRIVEQSPEFSRVVYSDPTAQHILSNLDRIGQAYRAAVEHGEGAVAAAKTAGKASVASTAQTGRATVDQVSGQAADALAEARQTAADAIRTTRQSAQARISQAKASGRQSVEQARTQARAPVKATQAKIDQLSRSSLTKFGGASTEGELANLARGVALGPGSIWGGLSILRLLRSAKSSDLIEWAAYSDANTQRMVNILTGYVPERVLSGFMREAGSVLENATPAKTGTDHQGDR